MTYNTEAVILRIRDHREDCRLFTIYSKELGKIRITARSVRKAKGKLKTHLQYFSALSLHVAKGRMHDIVAGVVTESNYRKLRKDLFAYGLASYCLEMVDRLVAEGYRDEVVYHLVLDLFQTLEKASLIRNKREMVLAVHVFTISLVSHLGYAPTLNDCSVCHNEVEERIFFSYLDGGSICSECKQKANQVEKLQEQTFQILAKMISREKIDFEIKNKSFSELNRVVPIYLKYRLGSALNSEDFLRILS